MPSLLSNRIPACIFLFHLLPFSCTYQFNPNTNSNTTCNFSCIIQLHVLHLRTQSNRKPYHHHLTCLTCSSYIFELHVSACLDSLSLLSLHLCLFTLSCSSKPQRQLSFVLYSLYHVSLACLCLCLLISCFFILHCTPCLAPSQTQSALLCIFSLCILTSHPLISLLPSIAAISCNFEFYIFPYVLHLKSFVIQSYTLQPVVCLLFLYVLYAMHLCHTRLHKCL